MSTPITNLGYKTLLNKMQANTAQKVREGKMLGIHMASQVAELTKEASKYETNSPEYKQIMGRLGTIQNAETEINNSIEGKQVQMQLINDAMGAL